MTACAYRSVEPVLHERIAAVRERQQADRPGIDAARRVTVRRIGRAARGLVGVAFGAAAFIVAPASYVLGSVGGAEVGAWATGLLLGGWVAAWAAGLLAAILARAWLRGRLAGPPPLSGDVRADLARLVAFDPLRDARTLAGRWERASTALPLAAASLLGPLTVHWILYAAFFASRDLPGSMSDFGGWIALSVILVGHAHLALLAVSVRWAWRLYAKETALVQVQVHRSWATALLAAAGAACFPGAVLMAVPPVVVALTGLTFVPIMFLVTAKRLVRDRMELEADGAAGA